MNQPRATLAAGMEVTPSVRLLSPLGAGGMGAVWLADHTALNTRVVVKFMLGGLDSSTSARARFKREAEAASQVKSPHVVQTFDYGVTADGVPFIVMEHLEGRDLAQEIASNGALDPARVVAIVTQVSKALMKAHAANLLHRDIKPDNIFLCQQDAEEELFVKLLDFGIAKSHSAGGEEITLDGQTKTGQVVGTPFYMSPEQVTAQKVIDLRSDLWSLGVVAFEALTGKRPFDGPSFGALAVKIATGEAPRPSDAEPSLPASVDEWFAKACARDPAARFSTARELADSFRAAFDGIVSLSSVAAMADSGSRSPSSASRHKASHGSDGEGQDRPSFVLASTVEEEGSSSLARSEGGASVAIGEGAIGEAAKSRARRPPFRLLGVLIAVAIGAVGIGIGIGRTDKTASNGSVLSSAVSTLPSPASTESPLPMPDIAPVPSAAVNAAVPLVVEDAGTHVASHAPSAAAAGPRVPFRPRPPTSVKPVESAPPPNRPSADAGRHNDILF